MDIGRSVFGLIGLVVAVILIANVALPTFQDVADNKITIDNSDGSELFQLSPLENLPSGYTITYDYSTPTMIKTGNDYVPLSAATFICGTNDFLARYFSSSNGPGVQVVGIIPPISVSSDSEIKTVSFVIRDGSIDIIHGDSTVNVVTPDGGFAIVKDGSYVTGAAYSESHMVYITNDTPVYAMVVNSGTFDDIFYVRGSLATGIQISSPNNSEFTVTDAALVTSPVDGSPGLYRLEGFTGTLSTGSGTAPLSIGSFIVPENVYLPKANGLSDSQVLMLSIIPMIMVILPVIMAVRLLGGRD